MDPVSSDLYDLGAWADELQQLFSLAATGGSLPAHQQSVANQAQSVVEAIDAGAPPAAPEAMEWVGARCGESLTVVHPSGMLTATVSLGQVSSIHITPSGAPEWHIIFRAGFESLEEAGGLAADDEMVELPQLSVRISDGAETISDCSFMLDGTTRDERDWQGKLEQAASQIELRLQSVPEADELDDELIPGVGEGIEEADAAPALAGAGGEVGADLAMGAMGRRLVRGAVAGAAGLAAAKAALASKERQPRAAEPEPPPATPAGPGSTGPKAAELPIVEHEPVVWQPAENQAASDNGAGAEPAAPTPEAGPGSWFYVRDGQRIGPVSEPELRQLMIDGELDPQSFIRRESMVDWQRAADVPELGAEPAQQSADQVPAASADGPALVFLEGERQGEKLLLGTTTRIGRSDKNDLRLTDATVSSRHAVIEATTHGLRLSDLGSTNGTYVNQKKINLPTDLQDEDMVTFGAVKMQLLKGDGDAEAPGGTVMMPLSAQSPPAPQPAPAAKATPVRACNRCGEAIADGVKFCGGCGEPVAGAPVVAPPVAAAPRSCSRCGQPIAEGLKFCTTCGGPAAQSARHSCRHCGREVTEEDSFCPGCGRALAEQAVAEPSFCTGCGGQLGTSDRFCGKCGKPVAGGAG
jgi:hypothetical protein